MPRLPPGWLRAWNPGSWDNAVGTPPSPGGSSGVSTGSTTAADAAEAAVTDAPGILCYSFGVVNVAASQTAVQLYRMVPGSTAQANQISVPLPFRGSIVGITISATAAKSAGACDFTVYVGDSATAAKLTWTTDLSKQRQVFVKGLYPFSAGSFIDLRYSTDATFLPTTTDVEATLYVVLDPSTII